MKSMRPPSVAIFFMTWPPRPPDPLLNIMHQMWLLAKVMHFFLLLVVFRIGDTLLLGAHDVENCLQSEGCVEVEIIQVWIHPGWNIFRNLYNDIAVQCATFVGNSYQTFGLATVKTYQTKSNLTGPNKIMIFYIINAKIHIQTFDYLWLLLYNTWFHALNCAASSQVLQNN